MVRLVFSPIQSILRFETLRKIFYENAKSQKKLPHKTLVTIKRFAQERLFNEEDGL